MNIREIRKKAYQQLHKPPKFSSLKFKSVENTYLLKTFDIYGRVYQDFLKYKYLIGMLYLAPSTSSKIPDVNLCKHAGDCIKFCFFTSSSKYQEARNIRTRWFIENKTNFMNSLILAIIKLLRLAKCNNLIPAVRLNGLSDVTWEDEFFIVDEEVQTVLKRYSGDLNQFYSLPEKFSLTTIFEVFNHVQFYDYTKYLPDERKIKKYQNYFLCYSYDKHMKNKVSSILKDKKNIAIIVMHKQDILDSYEEDENKPICLILDGDIYDNRFLDNKFNPDNEYGKIILLEADSKAKKERSTSNTIIEDYISLKKLLPNL